MTGTIKVLGDNKLGSNLTDGSIIPACVILDKDGNPISYNPDPSNASNQTIANASLASIDAKTPSLSGGKIPITTDGLTLTQLNGANIATSLSSIDTKFPAQVGGKLPVTTDGLTLAQLNAATIAMSPRANTAGTGGSTPLKVISAASTNVTLVKASPGNLYSLIVIGLTSTVRYLKIYNVNSAPTVGTTVPLMTIPIPANTQGAGVSIPFSMGVNFSAGIYIAITAQAADNDATAVAAGDVIVNLTFA